MTTQTHSDLIAIVNSGLSEKLTKIEQKKDAINACLENTPDTTTIQLSHTFKQDIWKAVYVLNLFRYAFAVVLLNIIIAPHLVPQWNFHIGTYHPSLFFIATVAMLISAVAFTIISSKRLLSFNQLVTLQFSLDVILASLIVHSCGSVNSHFVILFFIVTSTGSVVLPKTQALSLASGAFILLFYEHLYSVFTSNGIVGANYPLLGVLGIGLMVIAYIISYLAQRIRIAELKNFVPGNETIESFLTREEVNALKSALQETGGNKTEAAKLLGMSFRSFRYKLTKYDIE